MELTLTSDAEAPSPIGTRPNVVSLAGTVIASLTTEPVAVAKQSAQPWSALADAVSLSPYLRPEWMFAYLDAYEPDSALTTVTVRRHGEVIGALPLIRERSWFFGVPVRLLRDPVQRYAPDPFDIACAPADTNAVAGAVWDALRTRRDWDVIELVDLPETGAGWRLMQLAHQAGHPVGRRLSRTSPFVQIPAGETDPLAALPVPPSKVRANLRRRMRNLEKIGPVELKRWTEFSSDRFDQFLELEHGGWKGRNGTSIRSNPRDVGYYRALAQGAARNGYLAMYALECDREPVAMHFGITDGHRYLVPKLAFSELHHEFAPGHLLIQEVIRDLAARGFTEFDFMGDAMPWKLEWTDQLRTYHRVHIFNRTVAGHLAYRSRYTVLPRAQSLRRRLQSTAPERIPA
jgi:CelD/BcsL family acetyltransferase involved in cellulose biosynthesis